MPADRMTNRDVADAFAAGRPAWNTGGSMGVDLRRDGAGHVAILMSYRTPVAILRAGAMLEDDRRYSTTTSKQVTFARSAVVHTGGTHRRVMHAEFRAMVAELAPDLLRWAR